MDVPFKGLISAYLATSESAHVLPEISSSGIVLSDPDWDKKSLFLDRDSNEPQLSAIFAFFLPFIVNKYSIFEIENV